MNRAAVAVALVLVAVLAGVIALRQATMSVHHGAPPGSSTRVVVVASTRSTDGPSPAALTAAQVALCRVEVHDDTREPTLRPLGADRFAFDVRPALDESDRRQLHGCLEDARIDRVQLRVEGMEDRGVTPAAAVPEPGR